MSDEWMKEIFSEEEISKITTKAERVIDDMTTYYDIHISMPRDEAINACRKFADMANGTEESIVYCYTIVESLIDSLLSIFAYDGINPFDDE